MHRKHAASIVALAVLALSAGCVGALGQSEDPAADANRTITVTATGEVTAQPDQAVVHVSTIARADTAGAAREQLAENVSALRAGLADANVGEDQLRTAGYALHEERQERPVEGSGEPSTTYVARQSFEITLSDTDRAGEVIDAAVASGATRVEGVQFTLSDDAKAEVKQEALTAAMEDARRNAGTLAAAENLSVGAALHVTNTDVRPVPYAAELSMAADAGGTTIDGGPVTVTATVEVVYEAN